MKPLQALAVISVLAGVAQANASTYNFENLPSLYWSDQGGGQTDIGSFYNGLVFGAGVQGIHSSTVFPAHSGGANGLEVFQANIASPTINISFGALQSEVSFWYTTYYGFTVTAYDKNGNAISGLSLSEPKNVNSQQVGTDSFADLTAKGPQIASISIVDTGSGGLGNFVTIDDLSIPDTSSTLALLGIAGLGMFAFRRKMVTQ